MRLRFLLLLAVLVPIPAWADAYRYVARVDDDAVFIDQQSIAKHGSIVSYWIVQISGRPNQAYGHYLMRQTINCATRRMRPTDMSVYDVHGVATADDSKGSEEAFIEPGTVEQALFNDLCLGKYNGPGSLEAATPFALAQDWREGARERSSAAGVKTPSASPERSIFQTSPLDAEIERQLRETPSVGFSLPDLPPISMPGTTP